MESKNSYIFKPSLGFPILVRNHEMSFYLHLPSLFVSNFNGEELKAFKKNISKSLLIYKPLAPWCNNQIRGIGNITLQVFKRKMLTGGYINNVLFFCLLDGNITSRIREDELGLN